MLLAWVMVDEPLEWEWGFKKDIRPLNCTKTIMKCRASPLNFHRNLIKCHSPSPKSHQSPFSSISFQRSLYHVSQLNNNSVRNSSKTETMPMKNEFCIT